MKRAKIEERKRFAAELAARDQAAVDVSASTVADRPSTGTGRRLDGAVLALTLACAWCGDPVAALDDVYCSATCAEDASYVRERIGALA